MSDTTSPPPTIRVLLADDHNVVREGFRALLDDTPDIRVVAETKKGQDVLDLIARTSPDVVVLDIAMPGNGLEVAAKVGAMYPGVKVLILSMHVTEDYVQRALKAGAVGYLAKNSAAADLEDSVRAVMRGEVYLSPTVSKFVVNLAKHDKPTASHAGLTDRQREVVRRIALGQTTKAIAHELGISSKTVEAHRTQLMDRLGIHDIAGLVRYALREGLIELDS